MPYRESEGCIVPLKLDNASSRTKPGNAGAGKASKPSRWLNLTSTEHSVGYGCQTWGAATHTRCAGDGGEPDALTAHVRFWEGAFPNWEWLKYCDTTRGNQVANRENKP